MSKQLIAIGLLATFISGCGEDNIAKVNGENISVTTFEAYLQHKRIASRSDEEKAKALDDFLLREALAGYIEKNELKDDILIAAEIRELKKEVLINRYFDNYLNAAVNDEAISNYYNANIADFQEKTVHVAHLILRTDRNMDQSQVAVKRTTAQEAYSKIQAGMAFEEAVKQYSEDAISAKKGGDLGWVKQGAIHASFSDKAFSLKRGEVSEPIKTPYGFHLLKVLDEPITKTKSLEEAKGQIRYKLREDAKAAEKARLMKSIKIEKA